MARSTRYPSLARPDVLLIDYPFHIHYLEKWLRKLRLNFDRDQTVGAKVRALTNRYFNMA